MAYFDASGLPTSALTPPHWIPRPRTRVIVDGRSDRRQHRATMIHSGSTGAPAPKRCRTHGAAEEEDSTAQTGDAADEEGALHRGAGRGSLDAPQAEQHEHTQGEEVEDDERC